MTGGGNPGSAARSLETVIYECRDRISIIKLNRPERMNALSASLKRDVEIAFFELARSDDSRCVVLTGMGDRAFCAGADIKERVTSNLAGPAQYLRQQQTYDLFNAVADFEKPVIAAINGVALGGGLELALCCDIRLAADHARLGLPEVKLGTLPAAGGTQRLTRYVGPSLAKELMFTGDFLSAEQARSVGLVSRCLPLNELLPAAIELATRIAAQPPLAVRFIKRSVNLGMEVGLEAGLQFERYASALLSDTDDRKEGMRAFVEKRPANFQGK
jgi:enoyl-CoA hydratase